MPVNQLEYYMKEYSGLQDNYLKIFDLINKKYSTQKVLYPGSYCHITPSLLYPTVVYVDNYKKIKSFFDEEEVLNFVQKNKFYMEKSTIRFHFDDYRNEFGEKVETFDLLISLNAGLISQACKKYLKAGGLLLANDEHYDARKAYVDSDYQLVAIFDKVKQELDFSQDALEKYFKTKKGLVITEEMIEKSITKPPSKDPYKTSLYSAFYLFSKK